MMPELVACSGLVAKNQAIQESGADGAGASRHVNWLEMSTSSLSEQLLKLAGFCHWSSVHEVIGALSGMPGAAAAGDWTPNNVATAITNTAATNAHPRT